MTVLRTRSAVQHARELNNILSCAAPLSLRAHSRPISGFNRPPPNYPGHVPLNFVERGALAIGSAVGSLLNPRRADLIAACGEATATPYFIYRLRDAMLSDPTGRQILRDRPRITSETLKLPYLRSLPENTVGRTYATWLDREGVSPDTRDNVQYIDDEECAYVMQRYRECHDFYHAVTGLPIFVEGELALKAFEFLNTLIPMTGLSLFASVRLKPAERERLFSIYLPWALKSGLQSKELINVYWEKVLEKDVGELRAELGIERPPDMREIRRMIRMQKKREKELMEQRGQ
ncbi:ubiquinone biosynthesis protein COQ4 [Aspergillus luchuensis]|uniref:4-hydroxy-3-methoxy-5-polyprenylbenzoate decarboxylase n=3 Tax=Aspergillus subgen. Circumdati TaxID=2720871 RepID=A0A146FSL5_ASPKA|nr:ubiquinone biosynthesis protein COQ4, mitochondrial precursor [Aspergillus eucalypticola CBS 122712]XP_025516073.1 ubiquinone biosynthesis protein COQ4, mitochondrial precursor [Aspergillus piperis CBS 112811]XP_041548816.1 ubiquinone biosynthesis protein [Aspergillus luchuensis]GAA85745.1 ubiquinone biosynthesis protein COQ4, mitochondrial precursor [Aspergillus luchuensis IFO 4308]PWY66284.1 ubiquinone biosynthesis protein COQ4, mitochondrial precursor [Aspergillus eucalypticola CBS 122712